MKTLPDHVIMAMDWGRMTHEELIGLCRLWSGEKLLFSRILERALTLVYLSVKELADEIGTSEASVIRWRDGRCHPDEVEMQLIVSDVILVRIQAFKNRLDRLRKGEIDGN